jgi:hypothetical protein
MRIADFLPVMTILFTEYAHDSCGVKAVAARIVAIYQSICEKHYYSAWR